MAYGVSVSTDLHRFALTAKAAGSGELRYVATLALTQVARQVNAAVAAELLPKVFDKPVGFTQRAFRVVPATKQSLAARILLKTAQEGAGYGALLRLEEKGGQRQAKALTMPVKAGLGLNSYGNLGKGVVRRAAARRDVFLARPGDIKGRQYGGLYQRKKGGGLKLLVSWRASVTYRPRLGFMPFVQAQARRLFPAAMAGAFARAMTTRRG